MNCIFISAIMDAELRGAAWKAWLQGELEKLGFIFGEDNEISYGDEMIGCYRFLECEEARLQYGDRAWFSLEPESPWLGKPAGFFGWTHIINQDLAETHLLPALVRLGRGVVARTDTGAYKRMACLQSFSLTNLLGKHGFRDGDAFLSEDDDYMLYVLGEVERQLKTAGLEGHIGIFPTHHNPICLSGPLRKNGQIIKDEYPVLSKLSVKLWTYDWDVLRDLAFWID